MSLLLDELSVDLPTASEAVRFVIRLLAALLAGGIIGWQREASHKSAGLRTHMLVCAGTALFVLAATGASMQLDAMSRVLQGLATGIGFLGAGAIVREHGRIGGLTTAATIWLSAALGMGIGAGELTRGPGGAHGVTARSPCQPVPCNRSAPSCRRTGGGARSVARTRRSTGTPRPM